jgi:hypothetical protein
MNRIKNVQFIHLVMIPFTGVGLYGGYRGEEWLRERIDIFKRYTLKSLLNQTSRKFIPWISFRPQEYSNPQIILLQQYLKENNIDFIMTFNGLMYWDDKYNKDVTSKIKNCARVVRGCWRNKTWFDLIPSLYEVLFKDKNKNLKERLDKSLGIINNEITGVDYIYVTRLDSDDMLYKTAIQEIQDQPIANQKGYVFNKGFIYNDSTRELAEYIPSANPPFHTILFPADIFFNSKKHLEYYKDFKSHEDIPRVFEPVVLMPDHRYCVLTHNPANHISTIWNHPFKGKLIENKEEILKGFGL